MCKTYSRFLSILFFCLAGINLYGIANAEITGNISLAYDLIEDDGDWSGEFEQRLGLSLRDSSELGRFLGLQLGFVWYGDQYDFRSGLSPTYSINLQGNSYSLSSGYSVRLNRGIIDTRLHENLSLFLPDLPTVRVAYIRQGTRDNGEQRRLDSTKDNIQLSVQDEIGPFSVTLSRRDYSTKDKIRGPKHDVESSSASGDVSFAHSFGQLLSFNGRYGLERLDTERMSIGNTEGRTRNYSLGFRLSPIQTITLSGTRTGRRDERETSAVGESSLETAPSMTKSDNLTNRLRLTLLPIEGIRLGVAYSKSDNSREAGRLLSDEDKSLTVDIEPLRDLVFSGRFTARDSQEDGERASITRRKSFSVRLKPIERLQVLTRLDQSRLVDYINNLYNDRDLVTTRLEARLTENLRTDLNYDWQRSIRTLENKEEKDSQNRVGLNVNYSFARMLNLNFRVSSNISNIRGSSAQTSGALSYVEDRFRFSLRYSRTSSSIVSSSLEQAGQRTTRTFTADLNQEIGQDTDLSLTYQSRSGSTGLGNRRTRRISFRVNSRL